MTAFDIVGIRFYVRTRDIKCVTQDDARVTIDYYRDPEPVNIDFPSEQEAVKFFLLLSDAASSS